MTTIGKQPATPAQASDDGAPSGATAATVQAFVARTRGVAVADAGRTLLVSGAAAAAGGVAARIAADLQRDLVRVPLSTVLSDDAVATAQRLDRVFADASARGAVLFFDEADALFGKRGDVQDSHDRYARIAADGLLQRIESHAGVTVLATRAKHDVDDPFTRRLRHVVQVDLSH